MSKEKTSQIFLSFATVLLSAGLSWIISNRTINRTAVSESQRESFLKEIPVMNKVFDISGEMSMILFPFIKMVNYRNALVTTYMSTTGVFLGRDTTYSNSVESDTTYYHLPQFLYERESFETVKADLGFIESHIDDLSYISYKQIKDLLEFVKKHPITLVESVDDVPNNEWTRLSVYKTFNKKLSDIIKQYYLRLNQYGLFE